MSIIPIRVPYNLKPVLASERRITMDVSHPLYENYCPVCDMPFPCNVCVLIFVGISPESQKPAGYVTGSAVMVHAACAINPAGKIPVESEGRYYADVSKLVSDNWVIHEKNYQNMPWDRLVMGGLNEKQAKAIADIMNGGDNEG